MKLTAFDREQAGIDGVLLTENRPRPRGGGRQFREKPMRVLDHDALVDLLCRRYGVSRKRLMSPKKSQTVSRARHVGMAIERELTDWSMHEVADLWGRTHTTVLHAERSVQLSGGIPVELMEEAKLMVSTL